MNYNILDYGAVSDGVTLNTKAIQSAIDDCSANGGGRVTVPAGTFVTGTIYLKSNIEFHLEIGALLKASSSLDDYNDLDAYPENFDVPSEKWTGKHLIIAHDLTNVALTGLGKIDGGGDYFFDDETNIDIGFHGYIWSYGFVLQKDTSILRPGQTVVFVNCQNVRVIDVTIEKSSSWCLFLHGCRNVQIRGVKAYNPKYRGQTDGIDIDICRNVTVSDCIIDTGDDGITLRGVSDRLFNGMTACENVTITNCVIACSSSAFRFGVGSGIVRNINVSNIMIHRAAKAFNFMTAFSPKGHILIEDININNVTANNVSFPFCIREDNNSNIFNISINNYRAKTFGGGVIVAKDDGGVKGVSINNMHLSIVSPPFSVTPDGLALDMKNTLCAKNSRHLFYVDNAEDISFKNIKTDISEEQKQNFDGVYYVENTDSVEY